MKKILLILSVSAVLIYFGLSWVKNNIFIVSVNPGYELGDQMFQYAANYAYAKDYNKRACRDSSTEKLNSLYNLSIPECNRFVENIARLRKKTCYVEKYLNFDIVSSQCTYLSGYLQNEKFFHKHQDELRKEFQTKFPIKESVAKLARKMQNENSVCMHIRKRDYAAHNSPILGKAYYEEALEKIALQSNSRTRLSKNIFDLYIFSDDVDLIKNHWTFAANTHFIKENSDFEDMYLFSQCKHNINANSSFSWWGAQLNRNPHKIVTMPDVWDFWQSYWVKDLALTDWIILPSHYEENPDDSVAILYVATGDYIRLWDKFYASMQKYFLPHKRKHYFVFTDGNPQVDDKSVITVIYQKQLKWPGPTLMRYHFFNQIKDQLSKYTYIYFLNANAVPQKTISNEILPTGKQRLVFAWHPGYYCTDCDSNKYPYERNRHSTAYIPYGEGFHYIQAAFYGGFSADFLEMSQTIADNIDKDLENGIVALWHDESHTNRYLYDYMSKGNNPLLLDPSYLIPEQAYSTDDYNEEFKKDPNIILLDKQKLDIKRLIE